MNYEQNAEQFAQKHGIKLKILAVSYGKHFAEDKQARYIFKCKLMRNKKSYTFKFGQSINSGAKEPTIYDILSCIEKYDINGFEDFCDEFGYNSDSINALKTYKAVKKESEAVNRLFSDIIEELREIQ